MTTKGQSRLGAGAQAVLGGGAKTKGGASASKTAAGASLLASLQQKAQSVDVAEAPRAKFSKIAPHPDNPRRLVDPSHPKIQELTASIKDHGFLQNVVLAPRDALLSQAPELGPLLDPSDADFISLIGHRRCISGPLAGEEDVPYVLQTERLSRAETTLIFLHENRIRDDLSPIEEAMAFRRLELEGMTQEEIAAANKPIKQPYVSKRLKLLELPESLQDAVHLGQITPTDAHSLRRLPEEAMVKIFQDYVDHLLAYTEDAAENGAVLDSISTRINRYKADREIKQRLDDLRSLLAERGIAEIQPVSLWPDTHHLHRIPESDVDEALAAGAVAGAVVEGGELAYYASSPRGTAETSVNDIDEEGTSDSEQESGTQRRPKTSKSLTVTPEQAQQRHDLHEASKLRQEACRRMLNSDMSAAIEKDILADATLFASSRLDARTAALVSRWMDREIKPGQDLYSQFASRTHLHKAAIGVALAAFETEAGHPKYEAVDYPEHLIRHIQRLTETGHHELSAAEISKLPSKP
ncbi:hypothetical protein D5S17_35440 [Pseudonocardiaceae bacterium YIM PH 21723]|nr:hypothetical protein D5S17_35440 [Pseudonocardiaceae bacterium YIM PH 21723]